MNTEKIYRIYALVRENYAYAEKSSGKELAPIRWRHLHGENEHTRAYFLKTVAPNLWQSKLKPVTFVLCSIAVMVTTLFP